MENELSKDFVIWGASQVAHAAIMRDLKGFDDEFGLTIGKPLLEGFPTDVEFHMDPDFPKDIVLADNVENENMVVLVSEAVHRFLLAQNLSRVEFLPVTIVNHKGRPASTGHVIVNAVEPVDAIDLGRSELEMSEISEGYIDTVDKLVLEPQRIPADRHLFRLKGLRRAMVVRRSLAEAIDQQGFKGFGWIEIADYPDN